MIRIVILLFCILPFNIFAQSGVHTILDARSIAMGHTQVMDQGLNAIFSNIAGTADYNGFGVLASAENRFLLSELQNVGVGFILGMDNSSFTINAANFGFEDYQETSIRLGYARQLSANLSLGGQIIYWNNSIPEYGNRSMLTFAIGIQSQLSEDLRIGAYLYNPLRQEISEGENSFAILQIGVAYQAGENIEIVAEVEKDLDFPARVKTGLDYNLSELFSLQIGVGSAPSTFSFGFGLAISPAIQINMAASRHEILGFTPGFSISYVNTKNNNPKTPKVPSQESFF